MSSSLQHSFDGLVVGFACSENLGQTTRCIATPAWSWESDVCALRHLDSRIQSAVQIDSLKLSCL